MLADGVSRVTPLSIDAIHHLHTYGSDGLHIPQSDPSSVMSPACAYFVGGMLEWARQRSDLAVSCSRR
eukprot:scaffold1834_cov101-Cylindrotheca_fusiformis.AAC.3